MTLDKKTTEQTTPFLSQSAKITISFHDLAHQVHVHLILKLLVHCTCTASDTCCVTQTRISLCDRMPRNRLEELQAASKHAPVTEEEEMKPLNDAKKAKNKTSLAASVGDDFQVSQAISHMTHTI